MQKLKKWWLNYWYHYKTPTIAGLFALGLVIFVLFQILNRPSYDFSVYLYTNDTTTSASQNALKKAVEKHAFDVNGDGKVNVQVNDFSFDTIKTGGQQAATKVQALFAELSLAKNFLIFTDEYRLQELLEQDILNKEDFFKENQNRSISLKDTTFLNEVKKEIESMNFESKGFDELSLAIRLKSQKNKQIYLNSQRVAKSILEVK